MVAERRPAAAEPEARAAQLVCVLAALCGASLPVHADTSSDGERSWKVGDLVDVETEDGMEYGAVIIGPATSGDSAQLELRFADACPLSCLVCCPFGLGCDPTDTSLSDASFSSTQDCL